MVENIVGFRGGRMQRGYGIGGMFKSLARIAIPLVKRGAKAVGKRALKAATEVGQDMLEGKKCFEIIEVSMLSKSLPNKEQRP